MDSSNGFKQQNRRGDPWEGFTGQSQADADDALITDPLVRQISELRAALGDSEARRAELEAVIEKVRDEMQPMVASGRLGPEFETVVVDAGSPADLALRTITERTKRIRATLATVPSVVLEDRDREVAARAVEAAGAEYGTPGMSATSTYVQEWLRERAAAIRKGDNA